MRLGKKITLWLTYSTSTGNFVLRVLAIIPPKNLENFLRTEKKKKVINHVGFERMTIAPPSPNPSLLSHPAVASVLIEYKQFLELKFLVVIGSYVLLALTRGYLVLGWIHKNSGIKFPTFSINNSTSPSHPSKWCWRSLVLIECRV